MPDYGRWFEGERVPFVNTSGESMPPFGVGAVVQTVNRYGIEVYEIEKPSASNLRRQYLLNSITTVAANGRGLGYAHPGDRRAAYDSGTPAAREGWGVKPGQWTLTKGGLYLFEVGKLDDSTNKWLFGRFNPLVGGFIGKTTASVSAGASLSGSSGSSYKAYGGTLGSEADLGWTTLPAVWFRAALGSGKWFKATWFNNGWEGEPLEC